MGEFQESMRKRRNRIKSEDKNFCSVTLYLEVCQIYRKKWIAKRHFEIQIEITGTLCMAYYIQNLPTIKQPKQHWKLNDKDVDSQRQTHQSNIRWLQEKLRGQKTIKWYIESPEHKQLSKKITMSIKLCFNW